MPATMPTAFIAIGCTGGRSRTSTAAWAKQSGATEPGEHGEERHRAVQRGARHERDADHGEHRPAERRQMKPLLALQHGEEDRQKRHEREDDLPEARLQLDERVVHERERRAELDGAPEDRAPERATARQRNA